MLRILLMMILTDERMKSPVYCREMLLPEQCFHCHRNKCTLRIYLSPAEICSLQNVMKVQFGVTRILFLLHISFSSVHVQEDVISLLWKYDIPIVSFLFCIIFILKRGLFYFISPSPPTAFMCDW